jgi:hypothetical protein
MSVTRQAIPLFLVIGALSACAEAVRPASSSAAEVDSDEANDAVPYVASIDGWSASAATPTFVDEEHIQGTASFYGADGETRPGGACLVADLYKLPCETDADCAILPLPEGGFHYCVGVNGDSENKRCWTRPWADGCIRGVRLPNTTVATPAVPARVGGRVVNWMTLACLSERTPPGVLNGCQANDPNRSVHPTSFKLTLTGPPQ